MGKTELQLNAEYAKELKETIKLRHEPVAVRLIREGESPGNYPKPDKQLSYCQAIMRARHGESFTFTPEMSACNVGASALGMVLTPEKVRSGEFHYNIGAHNDQDAVAAMIAARAEIEFKTEGAVIAPLKDADFDPDVVIFVDIPERVYWFIPMSTAEDGGRAFFSTAPFQAACVDATSTPMKTGKPNISIGCYGCRKRTDVSTDELVIGVPWEIMPKMMETLKKYKTGIMTTARRD